ncbi:YveK family protein [Paenibacillus lemnae]|uniref:Lipopolysaccharide biosynthesis protein n=1 Tax=Paenibacillus lemnae TaxID=1330551 RepID=A0A848M6L1_PAELE|nr:Wzz/FepE/Etk N-terminal domain-containing protein [Paenibacillus lemnae]NMO96627.1 lipopolysaccharide biosynthesis protein [Paenibacillus lemnae]
MSRELDLRDYFRIIQKRIWLIALMVILICSLTAMYSMFIKKPMYEASTKIVVNQMPSQVTINQIDINQINANIQLINTYKEVIKTPAILDEVVASYPMFQLNAEQLSGMINVTSVNNTQVMTVIVRDTTYVRAAKIVNAVTEVFGREISKIFKVENVTILNMAKLDPPVAPSSVEPNVKLNIGMAFVLSLMLGVGLSLLLEYLDDTIKTEEDVSDYLGLPTLAMITKTSQEDLLHKEDRLHDLPLPKRGGSNGVTHSK